MTTAPSLKSSRATSTSRPEIFPFSSNTLYALNTFDVRLHLQPRLTGLVHRTFVLDGRDVAGIAIEDPRLEHAAHQLSAARLRQHRDEVQLADHGDRAELVPHRVDHRLT